MIEFADPLAFLLLPLPFLVYFLAPPALSSGGSLVVPEGVGRHILGGSATGRDLLWRRMALPTLTWLLLVLALAGPRQLAPNVALPMTGRDLILAFDLSGSMVREDFELDGQPISRLEALKRVAERFARDRAGDRLGLVVFGSDAYVAAAPTFDTDAVADTIRDLVIGIPGRATNISDAMGLALKRLETSDAASKVVILLSDGTSNAGEATPKDVARLAGGMGIRVHTIAMGPKSRADAPTERGVVDAATLAAVAEISGGKMFRVRTLDDLARVAEDLDRLEPTARAGLAAETYRAFWIWPAGLAALLLAATGWQRRGG